MMRKAEAWGYRASNSNPCSGIRRNRSAKCERFLSDDELARLGAAFEAAAAVDPQRVAALGLILLTGC
ncbi:hypothetical protein [Sphingomonas sp.]|uniref:hypothetical protein n=1 Tax=Sphingomonas sp. TaxID=28214 RepID=UPI0035BBCB01